jgi:hypothetical protein
MQHDQSGAFPFWEVIQVLVQKQLHTQFLGSCPLRGQLPKNWVKNSAEVLKETYAIALSKDRSIKKRHIKEIDQGAIAPSIAPLVPTTSWQTDPTKSQSAMHHHIQLASPIRDRPSVFLFQCLD